MKSKLAEKVEALLTLKEWPRYKLAQEAKVSVGYLNQWLNGEFNQDPEDKWIEKIENALDVKIGELVAQSSKNSERTASLTLSKATTALKLFMTVQKDNVDLVKEFLKEVTNKKNDIDRTKLKKMIDIVKE
jgi:transcriptional regulator with XRE-family HTH domain